MNIELNDLVKAVDELNDLLPDTSEHWFTVSYSSYWTSVSFGELQLAVNYMNRNSYNSGIVHKIILFPQKEKDIETQTQKEFILEKVLNYKEYLQQEQLKEQKKKAEEERIKMERKYKRELKTQEQKRKLLEELKKTW